MTCMLFISETEIEADIEKKLNFMPYELQRKSYLLLKMYIHIYME